MRYLLALSTYVVVVTAAFQPLGAPFKAPVTVAAGLSAHVLFSNLTTPRGIAFDSQSNLLVVERGFGITAFTKTATPSEGWERSVVIQNANFTQGIQVEGTRLYASTASEVLLFAYDPNTRTVDGDGQVVVSGLPADGELTTHTLQLRRHRNGMSILISSGPLTNIDETARDPSSGRSQVRQFSLNSPSSQSWIDGQLIAYGIRNPAGLAFSLSSPASKLYIVENGASIDNITGLTPKFVNDNPADEMETVNLNSGLGKWYGFPDCTTIWNPTADPDGVPQYVNFSQGQQFSLHLQDGRDDAWCAKASNNRPPTVSFQAHSVPLDIKFYSAPEGHYRNSLSSKFHGDAFVSFHGSFNRNPPTGYGIVNIPFKNDSPNKQDYSFVIQAKNLTSCPGSCIRPVGLAFGRDGRLYASSDSSGELFVIERGD